MSKCSFGGPPVTGIDPVYGFQRMASHRSKFGGFRLAANGGFWLEADLPGAENDVRYAPESRHPLGSRYACGDQCLRPLPSRVQPRLVVQPNARKA